LLTDYGILKYHI